MSQNRIQHPQNVPDRNIIGGVPYAVPRVNKEVASTIEKLEDECGRLPDLYFRKFRLLEKMQMERPQYSFATNVRLGTNKPVFIQHNLWDKVLKEVYWRATDFKEEKKAKMAQAFHLSKKMKKYMSKKFLVRDELHFYHKLLCIQLSKELDDIFSQVNVQQNDIQIAREYIPPHELKEIRQREVEERQRKEIEEAEQKRLEDEKLEQDKFVDQFFNEDDEDMLEQPQQETIKSPLRQAASGKTGRKDNEEDLKLEDNHGKERSQAKRYKPIANFMKKMMELNPDSFDTPEMQALQEYRDYERKKDILDKLKDTIIKYGGKRKERPSIDNIFNSIYPQPLLQQQQQMQLQQQQLQQQQQQQQLQLQQQQQFQQSSLQQQLLQEQSNTNIHGFQLEKSIKNENIVKDDSSSHEMKEEEQQKPYAKQQHDISENNSNNNNKVDNHDDELKVIQNSPLSKQVVANEGISAKQFDEDNQTKEEQEEEIDYFNTNEQPNQDQPSNIFQKKENCQFNNNNNNNNDYDEANFLNNNNQNEEEKERQDNYFDVLASEEPLELNDDKVNEYLEDIKVEDSAKEQQKEEVVVVLEQEADQQLQQQQQPQESTKEKEDIPTEKIVEEIILEENEIENKESTNIQSEEKKDEIPDDEIQIVNQEEEQNKVENVQIASVEKIEEGASAEQKSEVQPQQLDINEVKEEFQDNQEQVVVDQEQSQQEQKEEEEEKRVIIVETEVNELQKNIEEKIEQQDNKLDIPKKEEESQLMEIEQINPLKEEISEGNVLISQNQQSIINDELNESSVQAISEVMSETEKIKLQIKNALHQQYQQFDQSVCSIMQVEVSKKRKKKDDSQKDTLNEEFLNHIKSLNPQIDPKKMKYENLNELLMFNYNKNQLAQDFDKIFEKTINNYLDFPREFSQIPRVQEVDEDEIEMKGQDLYDLPYETFCFTHGLDMDKFLKKVHTYLSCIVNQDKISKSGIPQKDLFYIDELFKTYPIARKDNNLFAIYTQLDNKNQQTCARVFNESFVNNNEKYRVVSLISKQPIFFFFFEYYQGIWGNKHHLIANSLNSNPITKHYQFNNKIVEKLDWTLKIKKKEKFAYLSEIILPTMYMFKGDNAKVNDAFQHFVEEKNKKDDIEYNNSSNLLNDEFDFEEAVDRREKSGATSSTKPQQQIFKNMNKCFANYFSQNRLYDVSNKLEYRKSIIEYARQVKNQTNKFNFDSKEDDKGKTIDYSSFTKMIKVEEVKALLSQARNVQVRPLSRKKVIIETNNELYMILNNLKNAVPQSAPQPQPPHGQVGEMMNPQGVPFRGPPPPHNPHMRGAMPPMMNRQNSNMGHGHYPQYPHGAIPPNSQQHMNVQRSNSQYNEPPNGPQGPGAPPPPHAGHHNPNIQGGNTQTPPIPPQNMMHHRQGFPPPPPHNMNPSGQGSERGQIGVPPPQPHHHNGQVPPPYGGQPGGSHLNHHHHHHSMQNHQNSSGSQQNTPGGHPNMQNQPIPPQHQQMSGPGGMHHHPSGPNPPSGGQMDKQGMPMGGHPNGGMPNHSQPPPYHSGPPHGHGYPQGNIQGGPHQSQMPSGPPGNNQGMPPGPPMKPMHGHPNYPAQNHPGMNSHMQQQGIPPPLTPGGQMPNHPSNSQPIPSSHPPQQNHEPMSINKKIKKGENSPKKPPKKASIQVNPPQVSENTSEKGSPKKKKPAKKKKGQDDNQASQSQLSQPNQ